jgi:hypothetical protein
VRRLLVLGLFFLFAVPASAGRLPIVASQDWWPVWSPNGQEVAFTRVEQRAMTLYVVELPGSPAARTYRIAANQAQLAPSWSSEGKLAFSLGGRIYTANANGTNRAAVTSAGHAYAPAWRPHSNDIAYLTTVGARNTDLWVGGALWARDAYGKPAWSPDGGAIAFSGPRPGCRGHSTLLLDAAGHVTAPTGSCEIAGTSRSDVIQGTIAGGDVILAGKGNDVIHARNGHHDTVDCGPGRDTVWADRSDTLRGCEIVHAR